MPAGLKCRWQQPAIRNGFVGCPRSFGTAAARTAATFSGTGYDTPQQSQFGIPGRGNDGRHTTRLASSSANAARLERTMDEDGYSVQWEWSAGRLEQSGPHDFTVKPERDADLFEFAAAFALNSPERESVEELIAASAGTLRRFWESGAADSFEGSTDPCAAEMIRRLEHGLVLVHSAAGPGAGVVTGV
ncbi:hypothetical protein ACE41H_15535 [Paenibacillus enshidis]|uniref:Uncharacterized protein n=1 Tax=Paenibacillus enshidis TaxID=1458439 RepID=A0ABV5AXQ9_9BACL